MDDAKEGHSAGVEDRSCPNGGLAGSHQALGLGMEYKPVCRGVLTHGLIRLSKCARSTYSLEEL